jgi:hypothetical protein
MTQTLANRWWVDPRVAYLHKRDADVEIILPLFKISNEYAVAKLAIKISKEYMLEYYHKLQKEGNINAMVLSMSDLAGVFHQYLHRLYDKGRDQARGLFHIITHITETYKWLIAVEHFRTMY